MKIIITEEEKNNIKSLYGLNEQASQTVTIRGEQPYPNTDYDLVHGILGSKRIDDDLEERVGQKLKQGNYKITDVKVSSYLSGNKIITDGIVTMVSDNSNPDIAFTTRGSIGDGYIERHDNQVNGLADRLSAYYGGVARQFGPFIIDVKGTPYKYKQSFFAISKKAVTPTQPTGKAPVIGKSFEINVVADDLNILNNEFKTKLKSEQSANGNPNLYLIHFEIGPSGNQMALKTEFETLNSGQEGFNFYSILFSKD